MGNWFIKSDQVYEKCNVCETIAADNHCNTCLFNLCRDCVHDHSKNRLSKREKYEHDIVPFTQKKAMVRSPVCQKHKFMRCIRLCNQCKIPVCKECGLTGDHQSHKTLNLSSYINDRYHEINKHNDNLESTVIPEFKQNIPRIENAISDTTTAFDELNKSIQKHRENCHRKIDDIFDRYQNEADDSRTEDISALHSYLSNDNACLKQSCVILQRNKDILNSADINDVINYRHKKADNTSEFEIELPTFDTKPVDWKNLYFELGYLKVSDKPKTNSVSPDSDGTHKEGKPGKVTIIIKGRRETFIDVGPQWHPNGLHCTKSGDILVTMSDDSYENYKIVRYTDGLAVQEIQNYYNGNPLFHPGLGILFVTENNNGDICVSDTNGCVIIVLNQFGNFKFDYDTTRALYDCPELTTFKPGCIVTNNKCEMLFTVQNFIFVLDHNGHFVQCIDNCNLTMASALCLDYTERICVGEFDKTNIKIIKYR
ncbi:TRIM2_3 [Mytilus edulis]|uniref:TRIM2_3 n=1 Tax=Mytilus edulis TaxID=6550 RepID=A0A8S3S9X9_MYTED|nr:TRIM2_3 [Mytilus edulis]